MTSLCLWLVGDGPSVFAAGGKDDMLVSVYVILQIGI